MLSLSIPPHIFPVPTTSVPLSKGDKPTPRLSLKSSRESLPRQMIGITGDQSKQFKLIHCAGFQRRFFKFQACWLGRVLLYQRVNQRAKARLTSWGASSGASVMLRFGEGGPSVGGFTQGGWMGDKS